MSTLLRGITLAVPGDPSGRMTPPAPVDLTAHGGRAPAIAVQQVP